MAKPRKTKRPSKDQVRAWLSTVIAPIVGALDVERELMDRGSWSFRCGMQDFEFLWPTDRMVAEVHRPNLEQFWRYNPPLRELGKRHDALIDSLRVACRRVFERLLHEEEFLRIAATVPGADQTAHKYFAEYVVNGIRDLGLHYTYHEGWKLKGDEFLALRERPAFADDVKSLPKTGGELRQVVDQLDAALSDLQQELADRYQLPPVDPTDTATV